MKSFHIVLAVITAVTAARDFVSWTAPSIRSNRPQTEADVARTEAFGRFPGPLLIELLQPTLDPLLPEYTKPAGSLSGNYTLAASDVLKPLCGRWIDTFMMLHPNVTLSCPPPYSGSRGTEDLLRGERHAVLQSRELRPVDQANATRRFGYELTEVPIVGGSYRGFGYSDAFVFVVRKENPVEWLTYAELDGILSTTRWRGGRPIRTWGDLGGGRVTGPLAGRPIHIYGLKPWNGGEEFVRQRVLSVNGSRGECEYKTLEKHRVGRPLFAERTTIL